MSGDLFSHIQALLGAQPPSASAASGWTTLIAELQSIQKSDSESIPSGKDIPFVPAAIPLPSLLEFYKPDPNVAAKSYGRLDAHEEPEEAINEVELVIDETGQGGSELDLLGRLKR